MTCYQPFSVRRKHRTSSTRSNATTSAVMMDNQQVFSKSININDNDEFELSNIYLNSNKQTRTRNKDRKNKSISNSIINGSSAAMTRSFLYSFVVLLLFYHPTNNNNVVFKPIEAFTRSYAGSLIVSSNRFLCCFSPHHYYIHRRHEITNNKVCTFRQNLSKRSTFVALESIRGGGGGGGSNARNNNNKLSMVVSSASLASNSRQKQQQTHGIIQHNNNNSNKNPILTSRHRQIVNKEIEQTTKVISGRLVSLSIALITTVGIGYYYKDPLCTIWTNEMTKFRIFLLQQLTHVQGMGWKGNVLYVIFLSLWEAFGLPTTPVETSAGMAFPLRQALWMNPIGKNIGAYTCIMLIRYQFSKKARELLNNNPSSSNLFDLINTSATNTPLRVATLLRFAPFPELLKHILVALLKDIHPFYILFAVIIHGTPFSLLWALAGHEASQQLLYPNTYISSKIVQFGVAGCLLLGLIIVPTLFGLWINNLRMANEYTSTDTIIVQPLSTTNHHQSQQQQQQSSPPPPPPPKLSFDT